MCRNDNKKVVKRKLLTEQMTELLYKMGQRFADLYKKKSSPVNNWYEWNRIIFFCFLLNTLLHVNPLYSQESKIRSIDMQVTDQILYVRTHLINLFDDNLKNAIASGMSRGFTLELQLLDKDQNRINNTIEHFIFKYDVWERIYILSRSNDEKQFNSFENFALFVSDSMQFVLGTITNINNDKSLQLMILFSQLALSELQNKKLKYWLSREAETSESQAGAEPDQSFSINLSKMLSLFFSKRSSDDVYLFKSTFFTIKSLIHDKNP